MDQTSCLDPDLVGCLFVKHFYTVLNRAPHYAYRFFGKESSFSFGELGEPDSRPVVGQENIRAEIERLDLLGCRTKVSRISCQQTLGGGVLVQVYGAITTKGASPRAFYQTAILAPLAPRRYFALNFIFRFKDSLEIPENGSINKELGLESPKGKKKALKPTGRQDFPKDSSTKEQQHNSESDLNIFPLKSTDQPWENCEILTNHVSLNKPPPSPRIQDDNSWHARVLKETCQKEETTTWALDDDACLLMKEDNGVNSYPSLNADGMLQTIKIKSVFRNMDLGNSFPDSQAGGNILRNVQQNGSNYRSIGTETLFCSVQPSSLTQQQGQLASTAMKDLKSPMLGINVEASSLESPAFPSHPDGMARKKPYENPKSPQVNSYLGSMNDEDAFRKMQVDEAMRNFKSKADYLSGPPAGDSFLKGCIDSAFQETVPGERAKFANKSTHCGIAVLEKGSDDHPSTHNHNEPAEGYQEKPSESDLWKSRLENAARKDETNHSSHYISRNDDCFCPEMKQLGKERDDVAKTRDFESVKSDDSDSPFTSSIGESLKENISPERRKMSRTSSKQTAKTMEFKPTQEREKIPIAEGIPEPPKTPPPPSTCSYSSNDLGEDRLGDTLNDGSPPTYASVVKKAPQKMSLPPPPSPSPSAQSAIMPGPAAFPSAPPPPPTISISPGPTLSNGGAMDQGAQMFVGNLTQSITEDQLRDFFSAFGHVLDVRLNKRCIFRNGNVLPNYGFVSFLEKDTIKKVLQHKPLYMNNHRLNVEERIPNTPARPRRVNGAGDSRR